MFLMVFASKMDTCRHILYSFVYSFLVIIGLPYISSNNFSFIDLPEAHLSFYFNNYPQVAAACGADVNCPYHDWLQRPERIDAKRTCWGYEDNCEVENAFSRPKCMDKTAGGDVIGDEHHLADTFYEQADFGEYLAGFCSLITVSCIGLMYLLDISIQVTFASNCTR